MENRMSKNIPDEEYVDNSYNCYKPKEQKETIPTMTDNILTMKDIATARELCAQAPDVSLEELATVFTVDYPKALTTIERLKDQLSAMVSDAVDGEDGCYYCRYCRRDAETLEALEHKSWCVVADSNALIAEMEATDASK
jgi:hypothetical protein